MVKIVEHSKIEKQDGITFGDLAIGEIFNDLESYEDPAGCCYMKIETFGTKGYARNAIDLLDNVAVYFADKAPVRILFSEAALTLGNPTFYRNED